MTSRILEVFEPIIKILPEIKNPSEEISFQKRGIWTLTILFFYSILTYVPLIGANLEGGDFFGFARTITASGQGSLAELGILPLIVAGLLVYFLKAVNKIKIDPKNNRDRFLYNGFVKILAILFTFIGAGLLIASGTYGARLGVDNQILIIIQLLLAGIVIIYLDEIIHKGWGLESGISLFIISTGLIKVIHGLFAPNNILEGFNNVFSARGLVLAFTYWTGEEGPLVAFGNLFFRYNSDPSFNLNLPALSIMSLIIGIIMFSLIIKLKSMQYRISNSNPSEKQNGFKNEENSLPNLIIPLLLTKVVLVLFRYFSYFIWVTSGGEGTTNFFVSFFGTFRLDIVSEQYVLTGGLAYFLSPASSLVGDSGVFNFADPLTSIIQTVIFAVIFYALFRYFNKICMKNTKDRFSSDQMNEANSYWKKIVIITILAEITNPLGLGLGVVILALVLFDYLRLIVNKDQLSFINVFIRSDEEKKEIASDFGGIQERSYWIFIGLLAFGLSLLKVVIFVILGREL